MIETLSDKAIRYQYLGRLAYNKSVMDRDAGYFDHAKDWQEVAEFHYRYARQMVERLLEDQIMEAKNNGK